MAYSVKGIQVPTQFLFAWEHDLYLSVHDIMSNVVGRYIGYVRLTTTFHINWSLEKSICSCYYSDTPQGWPDSMTYTVCCHVNPPTLVNAWIRSRANELIAHMHRNRYILGEISSASGTKHPTTDQRGRWV